MLIPNTSHRRSRAALVGGMLAVGAASLGAGAPAASPATAPVGSQPATRPAGDRTSPDKTWSAMCTAVRAGDRKAFRACCYNHNEISMLFMDAYSDTIITTYQLAQATAQLGDEGKKLGKDFETTYNDLVKIGENRKVDIDEDTAIWIQDNPTVRITGQRALFFKKVNGEWLLDVNRSYSLDSADGRKVAEGFLESTAPQLKFLKAVIADIQAGKITTIDQLRERLSAKIQ